MKICTVVLNGLARDGSRLLQKLSTDQRQAIINKMASNLIDYSKDILRANTLDLEEASKSGWREFSFFFVLFCIDIYRRFEIITHCSTWSLGKEITNSIQWSSTNRRQSQCSRFVSACSFIY